ncbi:hypothetical protein D4764_09G0005870 [Takifugu flavidus]|uniref:Uncharacterized protein n=1 Tax=Takifugu flavidus TaxID=433684 RepID=A0A5C6MLP5_9TELE|nr:hypothetical protein D4764_09G0005870 [Takifugu flavidus]
MCERIVLVLRQTDLGAKTPITRCSSRNTNPAAAVYNPSIHIRPICDKKAGQHMTEQLVSFSTIHPEFTACGTQQTIITRQLEL